MTDILSALLGTTDLPPSNTNVGKLVRRRGVSSGPEFLRIERLPRRVPEASPATFSSYERGNQSLFPQQAIVLSELYTYGRGHVAVAKVGGGKSLIGFLAPEILNSSRAVMFQPAKLISKTEREKREVYGPHWRFTRDLTLMSYEKLGLVQYENWLNNFKPDFIILDEAHKVRRAGSGRAKRLRWYLEADPTCRLLVMTGTALKDRIEDLWLAAYALHDLCPIPTEYKERTEWGEALNVKVPQRLAPGVLSTWAEDPSSLESVRQGVFRRMSETPGFTVYSSAGYDGSLSIVGHLFNGYGPDVDAKFRKVREDYETPDGIAFKEPALQWQYLREMSTEFWYRVDPPPPDEWKEARRNWGCFVREDIAHNKSQRVTELQVAQACASGRLKSFGIYEAWRDIRKSYDIDKHREAEWFGSSVIDWTIAWAKREKGIVFVPYSALGDQLEQVSGLPYFGAGMSAALDVYKGGPCFASITMASEGLNLQDRYNKLLVLGGESSAGLLEQIIGRIHRPGQPEPECEAHFLLGCLENWEALKTARRRAEMARDLEGNVSHKLLIGDWLVPTEDELGIGPRWEK